MMTVLVPNTLRSLIASLMMAAAVTPSYAQSPCDADLDHDGIVAGADLAIVLGDWGSCKGCQGDVTNNGVVDGIDLAFVLTLWGGGCRPSLDSISPASGWQGGGMTVRIDGVNLGFVTSVTFGGAQAQSVTVLSSNSIEVVTPAGGLGAVDVIASGSNGTAVLPAGFEYFSIQTPTWATLIEPVPDPAIVYDANLRDRIIATGWAWKVADSATGIEVLLIPPGSYYMGCSSAAGITCGSDVLAHPVTITQPFYIGRTEVTQQQWTAVMGYNPSGFGSASAVVPASEVPKRPVEQVSWGMTQSFMAVTGFRLPTEAEWEYACRGGTLTAYHGWSASPGGTNDSSLVSNIGWWIDNSHPDNQWQTRPVGLKAANGFGLHDMAGSVWEWCRDWYDAGYYSVSPIQDPQGPANVQPPYRVLRGGSWFDGSNDMRSFNRFRYPDGNGNNNFGFRVARNP